MSSPRAAAGITTKLLLLLAGLTFLTFVTLAIDRQASFLFGGSAAYLTTAVGKWIPPDRGFVYGLLLRPLAVWPRSLEPVVVTQALAAIVSSWVVAFALVRYFRARFLVAAWCAIACAVEPLQLMAQRYILPDSLALFVFTLFLLASFSYLKSSSLSQLALVQILGVVLVSLRLTFLLIVIVLSVLLPLLSRRARSFWKRWNWMRGLRYVAVPLLFSVVVSQGLLFGYRYLYGDLIGKPPAYLYRDGLFLVADVAPLLKPARPLKYPLTDRTSQRWAPGGLCDLMVRDADGNEDVANAHARDMAWQAMAQNPVGVVGLALKTYGEYFHYVLLREELITEEGRSYTVVPREKEMLANVFGVDPARLHFDSFTKRWESHATVWCWFVMVAPFVYFVYVAVRRRVSAFQIVCLVCALILVAEAVFPVEHPVALNLIPLAWLTILMAGTIHRVETRKSSGLRGWSVRRASVSGLA